MHVDLGSGDACGPYRWARQATDWLFIATDLNPDALSETAGRASRKPSRGGVPNLICIAEPTEILAAELGGVANRVSVILPWGSLLRGVALPDTGFVNNLRLLCTPAATVEFVFSYDERRDAGQQGRLGFASIKESDVCILAESYKCAGFRVASIETISQSDLRSYETTWAKRLSFARQRMIWRVRLTA